MNTRKKINKKENKLRIAFVCVENAGRSQIATAFAKEEVKKRDLNIEIITGGTMPAEHVHDVVVEAMQEKGYDIRDQVPRKITSEEIEGADYVITMGCSAEDVCPITWTGESREWDLMNPKNKELETVRDIRDEIAKRVENLFEEIEKSHFS